MRPLFPAFLLLLAAAPAALPGESEDALFRAQVLERTEGDLEGALALYRSAAASGDPATHVAAALGVGRCLRRLGRAAEAGETLEALLSTGLAAEEEDAVRRELDLARRDLAAAAPSAAAPDGEEDARRRLEREAAYRAELAAYALSQARALFREGRLSEAREWVGRALEQQPVSEEARELLLRLTRTPGGRERLVQDALRLLDLEHRLRLAELRGRVDGLLAAGEEDLLRGEPDRAAKRFLDCLDAIDSHPAHARELASRHERAEDGLRRSGLRGATPPMRVPPPPGEDPQDRWRETLRLLLADATSPPLPGQRRLAIHSLSGFAADAVRGAPGPSELSPATRRPPPGPLTVLLLPALFDPGGWVEGGHFATSLGDDLVVYAPDAVQARVAELLRRAGAGQDAPVSVRVEVMALDPGTISRAASELSLDFAATTAGARAVLPAAAAARLREVLRRAAEPLGQTTVAIPADRTEGLALTRRVNLIAPTEPEGSRTLAYGLAVDLLAARTDGGVALAVAAESSFPAEPLLLPGSGGERQVPSLAREQAEAAAALPEGGTLVLAGLRNPFAGPGAPSALLILLSPAAAGEDTATPAAPAPGPRALDLLGLDREVTDEPAPPLRGEAGHAAEGRTAFLLATIRERVGEAALSGASLTLRPGVVGVEGPDETVDAVRRVIEDLRESASHTVAVRIRAAALTSAEEGNLLRGLVPGGSVTEGDAVRTFRLTGEDRRRVSYFLAGAEGRVPLLSGTAAARSTQLVNLGRVTRTGFLREVRAGEAGRTWPVYDFVDEGFVVEVRPVRLPEGTIDLSASLRVGRLLVGGEEPAPFEAPPLAVSYARVRATLTPDDALLAVGLPSPSPAVGRRDRLAVLLAAAEGMPK